MNDLILDSEIKGIIDKKLSSLNKQSITIGTGITSSHMGDERNLREYLLANEVNSYIQLKGYNTFFYLADDSLDPLNFRQLRIAVKKDERLINKYISYCGTPISLIPDPYECHSSYSQHFKKEILKRFMAVGLNPTLVNIANYYDNGQYDFAKEIIFSRFNEVQQYLNKKFPNYTMKKIFYALCKNCAKIDQTTIRVAENKIHTTCKNCNASFSESYNAIKGKFSWKIDCAIKWNIFQTDFEPFNKAYLDPITGSYFIAKEVSLKFFNGNYPEILKYGQVLIKKDLSYQILPSIPIKLLRYLFLKDRRKDLYITKQKLIQIAKDLKIRDGKSYLDFVKSNVPESILSCYLPNENYKQNDLLLRGLHFSECILNLYPFPRVFNEYEIKNFKKQDLNKIADLFEWVIAERVHNNHNLENFKKDVNIYLKNKKIKSSHLFPKIRALLHEPSGAPISRNLYALPISFIANCIKVIKTNE